MKTLLATTLALLATAAAAQAQTPGCAQVEVSNVRPQQGHLMIAAYADAESYNKKPLVSLRLPAGEATMSFQVCGLSGAQVALALFQDLDSDGKMGKNLLGIPTEPWGGSGTPGTFGPSWDNGRVALDGKTIAVRLSQ
jgi:uncharacterized protein (DUF2141 family)